MLQREACAWLLSPSLQPSDAHSEERQVPGRQGGGDGESRGKNDQTPDTLRITAVIPVLASIFFALRGSGAPTFVEALAFSADFESAGPASSRAHRFFEVLQAGSAAIQQIGNLRYASVRPDKAGMRRQGSRQGRNRWTARLTHETPIRAPPRLRSKGWKKSVWFRPQGAGVDEVQRRQGPGILPCHPTGWNRKRKRSGCGTSSSPVR